MIRKRLLRAVAAILAAVMAVMATLPAAEAGPLRSLVRTYATMRVVGTTVRAMRTARIAKRATTIRRYFREIENVTGHKITKGQFAQLKRCLNGTIPGCINPANASARSWKNAKARVMDKWEADTGKTWNRYAADVPGKSGVPQARAGSRWDGHHIIPKEYGGPHEAWNIVPAPKPIHRGFLHRGM